ncbi:hypothetical protein [Enterocloster citroniae]
MENINCSRKIQERAEEIKAQGYQALCFWLPAFDVGGGTFLLFQLAEYISKNSTLKTYYVDYEKGYPHSLASKDSNVIFLNFKDGDYELPIKEPIILITNTTRASQITNMHQDSKLVFWHYETFRNAWESVFFFNETPSLFKLMRDNQAIFYHDWSGKMSMNMQCKSIQFNNKDYMQVFLEPLKNVRCPQLVEKDSINVGWVGRLGHDKIYALFNMIERFAEVKTPKKKRLFIVGDGLNRKDVEEFCKKFDNNIEFIFAGTIPHDKLPQYLQDNIDVLFAVGTSVIEGARLKIPSVILMVSPRPYDMDSFIWLYDTKEYGVSILPEHKDIFNVKYTAMECILAEVYEQGKKQDLGMRCYEYYIENHSCYEEIISKFLGFCINSTLKFWQLKKCIKFVPYNIIRANQLCIRGHAILSKVEYRNLIKYKIFSKTYFEMRKEKNVVFYYLAGRIKLPFYKRGVNGYKFPSALFKG